MPRTRRARICRAALEAAKSTRASSRGAAHFTTYGAITYYDSRARLITAVIIPRRVTDPPSFWHAFLTRLSPYAPYDLPECLVSHVARTKRFQAQNALDFAFGRAPALLPLHFSFLGDYGISFQARMMMMP